jgi:hypothetical protein
VSGLTPEQQKAVDDARASIREVIEALEELQRRQAAAFERYRADSAKPKRRWWQRKAT